MTATCPHGWCTRPDHNNGLDVHESTPVLIPSASGQPVTVLVSYTDGNRSPVLVLGGVELGPEGIARLVDTVLAKAQLFFTVQPTPQQVAR